jgi:hypothetical protein
MVTLEDAVIKGDKVYVLDVSFSIKGKTVICDEGNRYLGPEFKNYRDVALEKIGSSEKTPSCTIKNIAKRRREAKRAFLRKGAQRKLSI